MRRRPADAADGHQERPVTVLQSFKAPRTTTNPYLTQLVASTDQQADVQYFSWRTALLGRYDVLHVHWPELVFLRRSPIKTLLGAALFWLVLLRVRFGHVALVRTLHNLEPHEHRGVVVDALLRRCDRLTTLWISLNHEPPSPGQTLEHTNGAPIELIPHGDYADWFSEHPRPEPVAGRILFFGLIRPYKGVPGLIDAFAATSEPGLELHIAGKPDTDGLAQEIRTHAAADPRIALHLEHVSDDELVREVGESELVVLPYREMNNSGALLLALSLDRPVLVPDNAVTARMAREVGEGWVLTYEQPLTEKTLESAWRAVHRGERSVGPDLSRRRWTDVGAAHLRAYRDAADLAKGRTAPTALNGVRQP